MQSFLTEDEVAGQSPVTLYPSTVNDVRIVLRGAMVLSWRLMLPEKIGQ